MCAVLHLQLWLYDFILAGLQSGSAGDSSTTAAESEPLWTLARLWLLLASLMRMPEVGPGASMSPALISAATCACQAAAASASASGAGTPRAAGGPAVAVGGPAAASFLVDALLGAVKLLAAKDRVHFSPSLEHRQASISLVRHAHI